MIFNDIMLRKIMFFFNVLNNFITYYVYDYNMNIINDLYIHFYWLLKLLNFLLAVLNDIEDTIFHSYLFTIAYMGNARTKSSNSIII